MSGEKSWRDFPDVRDVIRITGRSDVFPSGIRTRESRMSSEKSRRDSLTVFAGADVVATAVDRGMLEVQ